MKQKYILIIVILVTYFSVIFGDFIWDDWAFIVQNPLIKSIEYVPIYFTKKIVPVAYRPLRMISFAFDYQLWGINPFGYKLTNLLLFLICAILVYKVVAIIFDDKRCALFVTLLWALHPLRVESLAWVKNRSDILTMIFIMSSLILYIEKKIFLSLFFYIIALNTKETAVMLIFIIFAYEVFYVSTSEEINIKKIVSSLMDVKKNWRYYLLVTSTIIYVLLRWFVIGIKDLQNQGDATSLYSLLDRPFEIRLLNFPKIILFYFWKTLLPINLAIDYKIIPEKRVDFNVIVMWIILFFVYWILYKIWKRKRRKLSFGLAYYLATLIVISNLIIPLPRMISDHNQFIPHLGFMIFLYYGINQMFREKTKIINFIVIVLLSIYSVLTISYIQVWRTEEGVFKNVIKVDSSNEKAYSMLGNIYARRRDFQKSLECFKKAVEINPGFPVGLANLAAIYVTTYQFEKAEKIYKELITKFPDFISGYSGLGEVFYQQGKYREALKYYIIADRMEKRNIEYKLKIYELYKKIGDKKKNEVYRQYLTKLLEDFLQRAPYEGFLYKYTGKFYAESNNYEKSIKYYERAKDLLPKDPEIDKELGDIYKKIGFYDIAEKFYLEALNKRHDYIDVLNNLGNLKMRTGEFGVAEMFYKQVIKLNPNIFQAYYNLGNLYKETGLVDKACEMFEKGLKLVKGERPLEKKFEAALKECKR